MCFINCGEFAIIKMFFGRSLYGEVSEWLKEHAWKVCILERVSRVRIPPSPQDFITEPQLCWGFLFGVDGTSLLGPDAENKKKGWR